MRLDGKEIVITGATDGIGKVTARELAKMGASVTIVARDSVKAQQVIQELRAAAGHDRVGFVRADLSSQKGVRGAAETIKGRLPRLDVLINNAGAMFSRRELTEDGIERTFALNHLAYFLMTNLLLDLLKASAPSRIISVASAAHNGARLDMADLQEAKAYSGWRAYQRSKLANIYFTYELARRLAGTNVTVNCLHPGFVASRFGNNNGGLARVVLGVAKTFFAISEANGARTSVYLASSPDVEGVTGKYFDARREVRSSPASYDEQKWRELWRASEKLTGMG
ncbi:MAG: SDR family NAD(P)-dependent oxidoreductase [Alphaproteobacteria bacterium]|nr:SDR family NAD(P)-dependent oxidoreductase [Alphaproteobacteria bacterium]